MKKKEGRHVFSPSGAELRRSPELKKPKIAFYPGAPGKTRHVPPLFFALSMTVMSAACIQAAVKSSTYRCADGYAFNITDAHGNAGGDSVIMENVSGTMTLTRAVSASGAKYTNGTTTFWSRGDEAMVMDTGDIEHRNCRVVKLGTSE